MENADLVREIETRIKSKVLLHKEKPDATLALIGAVAVEIAKSYDRPDRMYEAIFHEKAAPTNANVYHHKAVYFHLALMNEDHRIIDLYHGEQFNTQEEAAAHGKSPKFQAWARRANMTERWVVVRKVYEEDELEPVTIETVPTRPL